MTWEDAVRIALELPGVEMSAYHGYPALRVAGRFLVRLAEDRTSVEFKGLNAEERALLIASRPDVFFERTADRTFHARLAPVDEGTLRGIFEHRWRAVASR